MTEQVKQAYLHIASDINRRATQKNLQDCLWALDVLDYAAKSEMGLSDEEKGVVRGDISSIKARTTRKVAPYSNHR